ncbi:hypothetical protein GGX14DRAFT_647672, partial [Mycena pura]
ISPSPSSTSRQRFIFVFLRDSATGSESKHCHSIVRGMHRILILTIADNDIRPRYTTSFQSFHPFSVLLSTRRELARFMRDSVAGAAARTSGSCEKLVPVLPSICDPLTPPLRSETRQTNDEHEELKFRKVVDDTLNECEKRDRAGLPWSLQRIQHVCSKAKSFLATILCNKGCFSCQFNLSTFAALALLIAPINNTVCNDGLLAVREDVPRRLRRATPHACFTPSTANVTAFSILHTFYTDLAFAYELRTDGPAALNTHTANKNMSVLDCESAVKRPPVSWLTQTTAPTARGGMVNSLARRSNISMFLTLSSADGVFLATARLCTENSGIQAAVTHYRPATNRTGLSRKSDAVPQLIRLRSLLIGGDGAWSAHCRMCLYYFVDTTSTATGSMVSLLWDFNVPDQFEVGDPVPTRSFEGDHNINTDEKPSGECISDEREGARLSARFAPECLTQPVTRERTVHDAHHSRIVLLKIVSPRIRWRAAPKSTHCLHTVSKAKDKALTPCERCSRKGLKCEYVTGTVPSADPPDVRPTVRPRPQPAPHVYASAPTSGGSTHGAGPRDGYTYHLGPSMVPNSGYSQYAPMPAQDSIARAQQPASHHYSQPQPQYTRNDSHNRAPVPMASANLLPTTEPPYYAAPSWSSNPQAIAGYSAHQQPFQNWDAFANSELFSRKVHLSLESAVRLDGDQGGVGARCSGDFKYLRASVPNIAVAKKPDSRISARAARRTETQP